MRRCCPGRAAGGRRPGTPPWPARAARRRRSVQRRRGTRRCRWLAGPAAPVPVSFSHDPHPAAVTTRASTPAGIAFRQASTRCSPRARWPQWAASAPQQPWSAGTTTSKPSRDSTRIAAAVIDGRSTSCTQPRSRATRPRRRPSRWRRGRRCVRAGTRGREEAEHRAQRFREHGGQRARQAAEAQRAPEPVARFHDVQQAGGRRPPPGRARRREALPHRLDEIAVAHPRRARRLAGQAPEAAVEVHGGVGERQRALERFLHQHDAPARRVHLLAEHHVGRAGGQAEAAVHARRHGHGHRRAVPVPGRPREGGAAWSGL